jgi:hypothetical protein
MFRSWKSFTWPPNSSKFSVLRVPQWLEIPSFIHSCGEWRNGTYKNFKEWSVRQFNLKNLDSDNEADNPVYMQKAKDISFERNKKGIYKLPHMSNFKTICKRQRVVRGYIGAVYCTCFN